MIELPLNSPVAYTPGDVHQILRNIYEFDDLENFPNRRVLKPWQVLEMLDFALRNPDKPYLGENGDSMTTRQLLASPSNPIKCTIQQWRDWEAKNTELNS